jgi:succinate dehydrogenase/fumarate reductase flavoprotein subunit
MFIALDTVPDQSRYDIVVVGAGAAGMSAALFAAIEKRKVLLVEHTEYVGGTSALSAATIWIPNSHHTPTVSNDDSLEKVTTFLDGAVGNRSPAKLRDAFLRSGPEAIATLEANSDLKLRPHATHPDYEQQHEGAALRGRSLEPIPFDGRALGADLHRIRPPIPEFTIFGGMMVDRTDINHLLNLSSWKSFVHASKILGRYGVDRVSGPRGSRLAMGNALIGRLLLSLKKRGVDMLTQTSVREFIVRGGKVTGVVLESNGVIRHVTSVGGVVLAAGGFSQHKTRRAEMLHQPTPDFSPAAPGSTGEMQDLALALGARFGEGNEDTAFWAPVSVRKRADGSTAVFPHFVLDRSKPGTVCVNQLGRRFVNESTSYHQFGRAMFESHRTEPAIPCFIITDAVGLQKYGLGMVRMGTRDVGPFLADGYLVEGNTISELAAKLKVPAPALEKTIVAMNAYAETGVDPEFGRGTTAYHRVNGDASFDGPNPTLGPIATAPYYAVRLYPGDIGAATGLVVDEWARVLKEGNEPIEGLYACGNEANSIMGGTYPGPGITLGPGMTFAYRAIRHALHGADADNVRTQNPIGERHAL